MTRDLLLVAISLFFWGFGEGLFFYFIPLSLQEMGASPLLIGGVYAGIGLAAALTQIPAGILSDKIGPRTIMWISWGVGALATWILAAAHSLNIFIIGILLYYMTSFGVVPLNSYVTRARGRLSPERALTFSGGLFSTGMIAGPILGGLIASRYGLQRIYLYSAGVFIISTAIIFFIRALPAEHHERPAQKVGILKNTRFLGFLVVVFITVFVLYLPQPLTPNYLHNQQGLDTTQIGLLGTIAGIGNAIAMLILGSLKAYWGVLVGQMMICVFAFTLWKGSGMVWYGIGYFMLAGFRLSRIMLVGLSRPLIHPARVGLFFGMIETTASLAVILAPALAGLLYTKEPSLMFSVCIILTLISIAVNYNLLPRIQKGGFSVDS